MSGFLLCSIFLDTAAAEEPPTVQGKWKLHRAFCLHLQEEQAVQELNQPEVFFQKFWQAPHKLPKRWWLRLTEREVQLVAPLSQGRSTVLSKKESADLLGSFTPGAHVLFWDLGEQSPYCLPPRHLFLGWLRLESLSFQPKKLTRFASPLKKKNRSQKGLPLKSGKTPKPASSPALTEVPSSP